MRFMGVVESQLRLEAFVRIVKYVGKMQVSGFDCKSVPGVPVLGDIVAICAILYGGLRHPPRDGSTTVRENSRRKRTISHKG